MLLDKAGLCLFFLVLTCELNRRGYWYHRSNNQKTCNIAMLSAERLVGLRVGDCPDLTVQYNAAQRSLFNVDTGHGLIQILVLV